jgi:hypothetical protein
VQILPFVPVAENWPYQLGVERLQESCNFAPGLEMDHRYLGSVRRSCDFDQGTIHQVEPPDERQHCGRVSEFVRLALPKGAPAGPPGTEDSRQLKPNELRVRQANIKTDLRKIAVAYSGLFRVCLIQQRAKD